MKRLLLLTALASVTWPATALASSSGGVVFSVGRGHVIQVIDKTHAVHAYHYRGRLPALRPGSRIGFQRSGQVITGVKATGSRAKRLMFSATVVHAGSSIVAARLADGVVVHLRGARVRGVAAGSLTRGSIVLVTELLARGAHATVAVTHLASGGSGSSGSSGSPSWATPPSAGQLQAVGTVVQIDVNSFVIQLANGSTQRFNISSSQLYQAQMSLCNVVSVLYDKGNPNINAGDLTFGDDSSSGQCADPGPPAMSGTLDAIGPIQQLTLSTVTVDTATGPVTYAATIDLTSGYFVGDTVDVTYGQAGDGTLVASDVSPDDYDAVGRVTAVSAGSVTIIDDNTGQPRTFTDDPSNGTFAGISVGDQIDVSYYYSNGHIVVDSVTDLTKSGG